MNTWFQNARALILALVALGVVGALVFVLVQSLQADRTWKKFVEGTATAVETAEETVADASELAQLGARVGLEENELDPLRSQIDETEDLLEQLEGLSQYVIIDEAHTLTEDSSEQSGAMAGLDIYSQLDGGKPVFITPKDSGPIVTHYRAIRTSLGDAVDKLDEQMDQVDILIGGHTDEVSAALSLAREALTGQVIRGQILMDFALTSGVPEAEVMPLRNALEAGQDALVQNRVMDATDAASMTRSLAALEGAVDQIRTEAATMVEWLGVGAQDLSIRINAKEFWLEDFGIPVATPDVD